MMGKFKKWLYQRYLPEYCREKLMSENEQLAADIEELRRNNEQLRAYIRGLHAAMRAARRIVVVTGGEKHGDVHSVEKRQ